MLNLLMYEKILNNFFLFCSKRQVIYSRSFKHSCPPPRRSREVSRVSTSPEAELAEQMAGISPISNRNYRERAIDCGGSISLVLSQPHPQLQERVDSAYGTDSNRTGSPPQKNCEIENSPTSSSGHTSGSSSAFNNDTYMKADEAAKIINQSDETYMSVHVKNNSEDSNGLLKRSPVVRDVTSGFAQISSTSQLIKRKMTILVPSLDKTISLEALNPSKDPNDLLTNVSNHDYENMALININRNYPLNLSTSNKVPSNGVSHWRTYSNMADSNHDESTAYEKQNYYDIYPLSKEMKVQLYRSLTPLSTAATMASSTSVASNDTYEPIENYEDLSGGPVTLIHHDGTKLSTRQITSLESLKQVLHKHEEVPMDDPQDRPDLYILAPMRILSPIMEESALTEKNHANELNKSLMTVISDILSQNTNRTYQSISTQHQRQASVQSQYPDGYFQDSIESQSSLVHTIEEIRNNSLCNLYYTTSNNVDKSSSSSLNKAAPQVPPRNDQFKKTDLKIEVIEEEPMEESPKFSEVQERRKKSALYTSIGSRKNLLELAGTTKNILNTPQKVSEDKALSILDPAKLQNEFDRSSLRPFENSHSLSPSAKYDTPTPPLKINQFIRNTNAYRPRRKFSILRDRFDELPEPKSPKNLPKKPLMIKAKSKNDLYENISDDFLTLRSNSMRAKAERMAKCQSVPSFINNQDLLKPDEQYSMSNNAQNLQQNPDNFMRRNQWSTASYQRGGSNPVGYQQSLPNRNAQSRRSMSILDDKENCHPMISYHHLPPKPRFKDKNPILGQSKLGQPNSGQPNLGQSNFGQPKMKSFEVRGSPHKAPYRLSTGASLSPQAKIFAARRT